MTFLEMPVFGYWLPYVGRQRIHLNEDGSVVDTGEFDIRDERGPYYVEPIVFEWFGYGWALPTWTVYETKSGLPVAWGD